MKRLRRRKSKDNQEYPYEWDRDRLPSDRRGQRCRKTGKHGAGNTVGIVFQDGASFIVAEAGLKRVRSRQSA